MSGSDEDFDAPSLKRWKDRFEKRKAGTRARRPYRKNTKRTEDSAGSHTMHTSHNKSTGRTRIEEKDWEVNVGQRNLSPHKQYCGGNLDARQRQRSNFFLVSSCPDSLVAPDPSCKTTTDSHHFLSMDSPPNCKLKCVRSLPNGLEDRIAGFTSACDDIESTVVTRAAIDSAGDQGSMRGLSMPQLEAEDEGSSFKAVEPNSLEVESDVSELMGVASSYKELSPVETCTLLLSNITDSRSREMQEHAKDCYLLRDDGEQEMVYGTVAVLSDGGTAASELQSKVTGTCAEAEAACFHGDTGASSSHTEGGISYENAGSDVEADYENTESGSAVNRISTRWSLINAVSGSYCSTTFNGPQPECTPGPSNQEEPRTGGKSESGTFLAPTKTKCLPVKRKSLAAAAPIPVKRQTTLLSFLSASSKSEAGKDHRKAPSSAPTCSNFSLPSSSIAPPNTFAAPAPVVPIWKPSSSRSRSCPFYKRVPGTLASFPGHTHPPTVGGVAWE